MCIVRHFASSLSPCVHLLWCYILYSVWITVGASSSKSGLFYTPSTNLSYPSKEVGISRSTEHVCSHCRMELEEDVVKEFIYLLHRIKPQTRHSVAGKNKFVIMEYGGSFHCFGLQNESMSA